MISLKILRIFAIWLIFVFAVLIAVLGFEFVNKTVSKSGFSSGEVFEFEEENGVIEGEILGRKFSADISPLYSFLPHFKKLFFLLPPDMQLLIGGTMWFFALG